MIRIGPGAARTIDSIELIEVSECSDAADQPRFFDCELRSFKDRFEPGCDARWRRHLNRFRIDWRLGRSRIRALGRFLHRAALGCRCCFAHEAPQLELVYDRSDFRHCYQRSSGLEYRGCSHRSALGFSSSRGPRA